MYLGGGTQKHRKKNSMLSNPEGPRAFPVTRQVKGERLLWKRILFDKNMHTQAREIWKVVVLNIPTPLKLYQIDIMRKADVWVLL